MRRMAGSLNRFGLISLSEKMVINRAAVILKYKPPFVQWINESDPYDDNPGITMEEANEDRTVYLHYYSSLTKIRL